jgi:aminopeptidase-like protein
MKANMGEQMHEWAQKLYPICRSITGPGVRETLNFIKDIMPDLEIKELASGTNTFDWVVPDEWQVNKAYITDEQGKVIVDYKVHNLHLVGYSIPIDVWMTLDELMPHLHSLPSRSNAIPYVTSYYARNWGFCLTHNQLKSLKQGKYHVVISSELKPGVLNYGELILPGSSTQEVFISTYVCHPSMGNNELSGPVVATALASFINSLANRRYTYRFIFIPETIGSIAYLSMHHKVLKEKVVAGFNLTCVGDDRTFSFLPSLYGDTIADRLAKYTLNSHKINFTEYSFLSRGSDERQYCWPGIDLPVVSIMRSKYGTYPEYHTSEDDLSLITPEGLWGALQIHINCVNTLENNEVYVNRVLCEPNLGKRNLYPTTSTLKNKQYSRDLIDFMVYCDGERCLLDIAIILNKPIDHILKLVEELIRNELIEKKPD